MENRIFGIIVVLISIVLSTFIYKYYKVQKYKWSLFYIFILGFLLRIFVFSDLYIHEWDERYHALVAKNMIKNPFKPTLYENPVLPYDYRSWTNNHIWVHKQPVALWSMALSMYFFGINEITLRLPSLLYSMLAILLTFQIAKLLFNKKIAIIAAFLHAIHGLLIELAGGRVPTDHIDICFQFFIELGIYLGLLSITKNSKLWLVLMGIMIGIAILTKWLTALIVLPVWFLFKLHYEGFNYKSIIIESLVVIFLILVIASPWQIYIHSNFPLEAQWEQEYNTKHLFEQLEGLERPFSYHLTTIRIIFGELRQFKKNS